MGLIRLLMASRRNFGSAVEMFRSDRVPVRLKMLVLALAALIVSPLNILGDIPLLGFFDDAALLAMLLDWFVRAAAPYGADTSRQTLIADRPSIAS